MPTIYVIAGPNGVGKTTFANTFLPHVVHELEFVNADLIARGFSPFDPDAATVQAGRIALARIREFVARRRSFAWETTLSGRTATAWMREARDSGYIIKAYFLWVRQVELTLRRIQQRVLEGGHDIPIEVARRRFWRTIQNLLTLYRPLFDSWELIENDRPTPRLLAMEKGGRLIVRDRARFEAILNEAQVSL